MANYKETTLAGTSYVRSNRVTIDNGIDNKGITFEETEVINLSNGETMNKSAGRVSESFTPENALTEISLINPETGADTGVTMTYQDLYVAVYSLYFKLALERDAFEAEQLAAAEDAAADAAAEPEPEPQNIN